MSLLRMVLAKDEMNPKLAKVLQIWVRGENPEPLINTFHKEPKLFESLDKADQHPNLFRVLNISKEQMKELITSKKLSSESSDLESWSTSIKGLQTFADRATDGSRGDNYVVVLKKAVPPSDRVVYIPSLLPIPGIEGSDEGWIEEEQEVICVAQKIEWKLVTKILLPGDSVRSKSLPLKTVKYQLRLG